MSNFVKKYLRTNDINALDFYGRKRTILIDSACNDKHKRVKYLLQQPNIKVNMQDDLGLFGLIEGCFHNNSKIVKMMLEHPDTNVNLQDKDGFTPLITATQNNNTKIIKLLLNHPNINLTIKDDYGHDFFYYLHNRKVKLHLFKNYIHIYLQKYKDYLYYDKNLNKIIFSFI